MRYCLVMIFSFLWACSFAQAQVIEIDFCDEMLSKKENSIFELSMVHKGDTLIFPRIGKKRFLNPIDYYDLQIDEKTEQIEVLFENCKYVYFLKIERNLLERKSLQFCSSGKKNSWGYAFHYGSYPITTAYVRRERKGR